MRWIGFAVIAALVLDPSHAGAAGDFPLACCKGWNGTVVERDGIDTARATFEASHTQHDRPQVAKF